MRKLLFAIVIFSIVLGSLCYSATPFKIVYNATANAYQGYTQVRASDISWLTTIKNNWGATGVCLSIGWRYVEINPNSYTYTDVDTAIARILRQGLDVYVRVSMGTEKPSWVVPGSQGFTINDFQIKSDGNLFSINPSDPGRNNPLNFGSDLSNTYMLRFFSNVMDHLKTIFPNKIQEVVPSVSVYQEMEFPIDVMCGYSQPEITKFGLFLQEKYLTKDNLNVQWQSNFPSFDVINPKNYYWQNLAPYTYTYPVGRIDWMSFRTKLLKSFIDTCASIAHNKGFKIGLQLGSIYDSGMELRGWNDVTSLIENVDVVRVADIIEYKPNFQFAADYLRSICTYWSTLKSKTIRFSTESNWPGYPQTPYLGNPLTGYAPNTLSSDWSNQLNTYYNKGSDGHFIYGWDRSDLNSLATPYNNWQSTLVTAHGYQVKSVSYSRAVHLGCEEGGILGLSPTNSGGTPNYVTSYFYQSVIARNQYIATSGNYDGQCDIITNYMISNNSSYIQSCYSSLSFTQSSCFISDKAYSSLMKSAITKPYINATWFSDNGHGEFAFTQGLFNEYGIIRSPIHLIWRSRPDLIAIWPDANLPKAGSGHTEDFISWALNSGCGYANQPSAREYPGWEIRDNGSSGNYKYDKNIRAVWNTRNSPSDLGRFLWGHATADNSWNIISWAKTNGYLEEPLLAGYNYWPYIGNNRAIYKISSPKENNINSITEYNLMDNYPNPFNPSTNISYSIPEISNVRIVVIDMLGREIQTLVNEEQQIGHHEVAFDASKFSSGVYFYRIQAGNFIETKKMLLMK